VAPHAGLAQLNERSREIFRQIVESYLATGEPVGSRNISRLIAVPLSPASVRNVMADLEQLGLIYAPHTSAGRPQSGGAALGEALARLSGLTRAAAVVLTAKSNVRLKHIEFVRLEPERALAVLVADAGQGENRIIIVPAGL